MLYFANKFSNIGEFEDVEKVWGLWKRTNDRQ